MKNWLTRMYAHYYWRKAERLWCAGNYRMSILWYIKATMTSPDPHEVLRMISQIELRCNQLKVMES